ncbi:iron ABC transporter permease [Olivibacter sp. SA151]|uniref:FecCD family ABC transporter permease n=1 Tax=Olivibacter jilunii TaxID=985016 RepID=UPI003F13C1DF
MKRRGIVIWIIFYGLPVPMIIYSLMIGSSKELGIAEFWNWLAYRLSGAGSDSVILNDNIITNIRLPRVLLTYLVGAGLASCGGALQAMFRNPLVDPYLLGISSGSAFGASLAILFPFLPINLSAFIFGALAVILTFFIGFTKNKSSLVPIILSGMIVSGLFTAGITLVQYLSDPYKLQAIIQWTMGNLHLASWDKFYRAIVPIMAGLMGIYVLRWKLNLLALGDEEAKAVGVNPLKVKFLLVSLTTVVTAASVAGAGIISLYGLFVPHITRMLMGADNIKTTSANIFFGGTFLLIIDNFSRTIMPYEVPIGVFTMILGAPFFIFLIKRKKINWL